MPDKKAKRRLIIFLVIFTILTGVLTVIFWPFLKNLQDIEYREKFSAWITGLGFKGVLILLALQIVQILAAVIPGGPIQVIAGAAYGTWGGIFLLMTGCAAATTIIFLMVRKFGVQYIVRFFGADTLDKWGILKNEKNTALAVFILFLIPGIPKDALTYFVPLTKLSLPQFIIIVILARFPAMFSSTVMGDAVMQDKWILLITVFCITAVTGILGIQFKDRIIRRFSSSRKPT